MARREIGKVKREGEEERERKGMLDISGEKER